MRRCSAPRALSKAYSTSRPSAGPPSRQAALAAPAGVSAHPTDYLQFFAPGNREAQRPDEPPPEKKAPGGGGAELAQLTRRFMVYVHSKMMIVDDEVRCGCASAANLGLCVFGFGSAAYLGLL